MRFAAAFSGVALVVALIAASISVIVNRQAAGLHVAAIVQLEEDAPQSICRYIDRGPVAGLVFY